MASTGTASASHRVSTEHTGHAARDTGSGGRPSLHSAQLSLTQEYTAQAQALLLLGPQRTARPRPRQTSATVGLARAGGGEGAFSLQERRTGEAETEEQRRTESK